MSTKEEAVNELYEINSKHKDRLLALEASHKEVREVQLHLCNIEENAIASDIIIRGIPRNENEKLNEIFSKLCTNINCPKINIKSIFRIKSNSNTTLTDAGVIVKLQSTTDKAAFLKAAAGFRKENKSTLLLTHAVFDSNVPIFVNECLTKTKKQILNAAVRFKRNKHVWAVFTMRGSVFIKRQQGDTPIEVTSIKMLNNFIGNDKQNCFRDQENAE